jgi:peptidyl-dipeptidase Dcp
MFDKNYFVTDKKDKKNFDRSFNVYKHWLLALVKETRNLSIKEYIKLVNDKSKVVDDIENKYSLLSNIKKTDDVLSLSKYMSQVQTEFFSPLSQSKDYYDFIESLVTENELEVEIKSRYLKSFENSGFNLPVDKQAELNKLKEELNLETIKYSENIIKSKKEWKRNVPESILNVLSEKELSYLIETDGKKYLIFNQNTLHDILSESKIDWLRKAAYEALKYPASAISNYDNTETTKTILRLKKNISSILGYEYFTELALDKRMATSYEEITGFLSKIEDKVKHLAKQESDALNEFALKEFNLEKINKWDRSFYGTIKKEKLLNYKYKMECPYFPEKVVFKGVFDLITELFGFTFEKDTETFILPYDDTECYKVYDNDKFKAYLIVDMYERPEKEQGAWVSTLEPVLKDKPGLISLCCNINKNEVGLDIGSINTLLHEMGHAIHNFSSDSEYSNFAGTNSFSRDAVEIPSQMLEQFAYNRDFIKSMSSHYETQEKIPDSMVDSIIQSKNYNIGSHYSRQLVFALFDINLYHDFDGDILEYYKKLSNSILPIEVDEDTNFPNTFSHIFSGGYSAGYYGYMWADIYSVDAYLHLLEKPKENALRFKNEFLKKGSSLLPKELYQNFKKEDVNINDFFRYYNV